jgi:hypothetical protein
MYYSSNRLFIHFLLSPPSEFGFLWAINASLNAHMALSYISGGGQYNECDFSQSRSGSTNGVPAARRQ